MAEVIILLCDMRGEHIADLKVPTQITADEFVAAVDKAFRLGLSADGNGSVLRMENPIALLQGEETLEKLGMRMGSMVYCEKR